MIIHDHAKKIRKIKLPSCFFCDHEKTASYFCEFCQTYLCQEHFDTHVDGGDA